MDMRRLSNWIVDLFAFHISPVAPVRLDAWQMCDSGRLPPCLSVIKAINGTSHRKMGWHRNHHSRRQYSNHIIDLPWSSLYKITRADTCWRMSDSYFSLPPKGCVIISMSLAWPARAWTFEYSQRPQMYCKHATFWTLDQKNGFYFFHLFLAIDCRLFASFTERPFR